MSHLKVNRQTSFAKIGAGLGALLGGWMLGDNGFINVALALTGNIIGNQIILSKITTEILEQDIQMQIQTVKNHFDKINPIETHYNLYDVDPIGENLVFSWIKSAVNKISKDNLDNKFISTKHLVLDYFSNDTPFNSAVNIIPGLVGLGQLSISEVKLLKSFEILSIYFFMTLSDYFLYQKSWLNNIESLELECNKYELKYFEQAIPEELFIEMSRVSL